MVSIGRIVRYHQGDGEDGERAAIIVQVHGEDDVDLQVFWTSEDELVGASESSRLPHVKKGEGRHRWSWPVQVARPQSKSIREEQYLARTEAYECMVMEQHFANLLKITELLCSIKTTGLIDDTTKGDLDAFLPSLLADVAGYLEGAGMERTPREDEPEEAEFVKIEGGKRVEA